jgi:hypothetical protein
MLARSFDDVLGIASFTGEIISCQQFEFLLFLLYGLDSSDNGPRRDLGSNHLTHEGPRMPFDLVSHGL